jgi:DNA-binding MarR family transcriptional regulator
MSGEGSGNGPGSHDDVVDALLAASRAFVAIAARSLAGQHTEVTLPQFRALVVLVSRGPQRVIDISAELGVDPSAGTRLCDRLVRKGLVRRQRSTTDRRVVRVALTPAGQTLVDEVTLRRREELTRIVQEIPEPWSSGATQALYAFAAAAGEADEEPWWMGWQVTDLADDDRVAEDRAADDQD